MTGFAGYAMVKLAELKATWPVFYMGFGALILVGIVITGFAGLLIVRTLEVRGPGGFVFKSQDADKAVEALAQVSSTNTAPPPPPPAPSGEQADGALIDGDSVTLKKD